MNEFIKKVFVSVFIFTLLMFPFQLTSKQKPGAKLNVIKTDGSNIRGELISVKPTALLLKGSESQSDITVDLDDIIMIRIRKRSNIILGTVLGTLAGGVSGMLIGGMFPHKENTEDNLSWKYGRNFGIIGMAAGAIGGTFLGLKAGKEEIIHLEGLAPEDREFWLDVLRNQARIKDIK
jgi:hypothetical protein